MENTNIVWSYEQFKEFLLLYIANADYNFSEEEKVFIKLKTRNIEQTEVKKVFDSYSDYEIVQTILSFKDQYFNSEEQKKEVFKDMKEILKFEDKQYGINEESLYNAIKELILSLN